VKRKILALVMAAVMTISTVGCGNSKRVVSDFQYRNIDVSGPPVTITYLTIGDKPINGMTEKVLDKLNELLLKKVNAKLDIYYIGWNDYLENYNKTLSLGNVNVDLIAAGGDWLDAWPNAAKGYFLPLSEDMLRTYCPQTYKYVSSMDWDCCTYDGKIYFIPENEYTQWINYGFVYRLDDVKNVEKAKSNDLGRDFNIGEIQDWGTLDEFFTLYREQNPEKLFWDADGKETKQALGYIMSESNYIPIYELSEYGVWGIFKNAQSQIVSPYMSGNYLYNYAKIMKKWNELGVWRSDFKDYKDNYEAFYNGDTSVVLATTEDYYTTIKPNMEIYQPEAKLKFFWFGKENLVKTSILHGAMAISSKSKNPERALMVYDILRNDVECYRLIRYGIEGVQYQINPKDMLERPNGYNDEKDGITTNFWWGRRDSYEKADSTYAWDDYNELKAEYNKIAIDYPWDRYRFMTTNINKTIEEVTKVCDKYIPEITYGRYEGTPEAEVNEFRTALKAAGVDEVKTYLQNIYDADKAKNGH